MPADKLPQTAPWLYGQRPETLGFYPTLKCWDGEEDAIPGAEYWDGQQWRSPAVVAFIPHHFDNEKDAIDFAYEYDPDV